MDVLFSKHYLCEIDKDYLQKKIGYLIVHTFTV